VHSTNLQLPAAGTGTAPSWGKASGIPVLAAGTAEMPGGGRQRQEEENFRKSRLAALDI